MGNGYGDFVGDTEKRNVRFNKSDFELTKCTKCGMGKPVEFELSEDDFTILLCRTCYLDLDDSKNDWLVEIKN